jgi:hypothetical protein
LSQGKIELEWILPESEKEPLIRAIEISGGTVEDSGGPYRPKAGELGDYPEAGFEPMTMILVAATTVYVVQSLVKTWRDRNIRGSTVVDARDGKLRIRRIPSGVNGQMVILRDKEPPQVFEREQENDGRALLQDLLSKRAGKPD